MALALVVMFVGLGLLACNKTDDNLMVDPGVDEYGVEIGTIQNYHETGCEVTVKKYPQTRTGFIDEVYEFSVDKPGIGNVQFIITMEELPGENKIVVTQYDEFWNEIVAVVYSEGLLSDVIVSDGDMSSAVTRGWFGDFWDCAKVEYRRIEKIIDEDDDLHLWCAIVDYAGACTVNSLAITAIRCF